MLKSVVESMGVTGFAQVALLLFFSVFMSVLLRESLRSKREVSRMASLPLADDEQEEVAGSQTGDEA